MAVASPRGPKYTFIFRVNIFATRPQRVKELKSTMSSGRKFHISTTRFIVFKSGLFDMSLKNLGFFRFF